MSPLDPTRSGRSGDAAEVVRRAHPPARVVIEAVRPEIDGGRFPAKRAVGDTVTVSASIFAEGHDRLAGVLRHRHTGDPDDPGWRETPLRPVGNDRFEAAFRVEKVGRYEFELEAWVDAFASWRAGLARKADAGLDVSSELLEGAALVAAAAARAEGACADALRARAAQLAGPGARAERVAAALSEELFERTARVPDRSRAARTAHPLPVRVDRERARSGAWYEFFPRSCSGDPGKHGTLRDAEALLEHAAAMGFDVVYLPPIHPIGRTFRKGPNNTPRARPGDPGSPWAIGSEEGGHDAVHPELGSLADFDRFVARARELGLEVALDLAFQCSPDHPWVIAHPEWFRHRPDGSIQYAENPPKKYQDIYPLDFECEAWRELWAELERVVRFWIERGVAIFRVDNPHTKPLPFWEWLIARVQETNPEVVFLAEAFTRPSVMQHLAKAGFSQSYSYFTWRNTKWELTHYFEGLGAYPVREYLRPNLFANTPDILHEYLQTGRRAAFQVRATLAATLAGNWGVYGPAFELCESRAVPGSEEYLDSEKYQIRHWDLAAPGSLRDWLARLNEIRRANPALTRGAPPAFVPVDNERLIAFLRELPEEGDRVLVVVNLDPHHPQSGWLELAPERVGLDPALPFQMDDQLGGARFLWHGRRHFVALDPDAAPAHVFRVRRRVRTERDFDYYL